MSFVSQRSSQGGGAAKYARSGSRGRSQSRPPTYSRDSSQMSQGGVPGGGVVKLKKQMPSVECKFFDTSLNLQGVVQNWTQIDAGNILSGIVQGTGPSERVGRKIKVVGFVVRLGFYVAPGGWCFDLVRDKQCNGAAATAAQVYSTPNRYGSLPNPFEETRFQFLKRMENFNPAQAVQFGTVANITECCVSFVKKVAMTVEYNATTGAITDLTSDNVQLYCNSSGSVTPISPVTTGTIRVLYTDA